MCWGGGGGGTAGNQAVTVPAHRKGRVQVLEPQSLGLNQGSPTYQQCAFAKIYFIFPSFSFLIYKVAIKILLISKGYCEDQAK